MDSRREFIKKAALLSAAGAFPQSIARAFSIDPQKGTTWEDAEHVVILMQENRSFDHCFGSLNGVRGFNDPRAFVKPDQKPIWLQANEQGETFAPFRLNIKDTKATWMGSLPHGWTDQVDVRNGGRNDQWVVAKKSGRKEYAHMPLTLGYYNREDLPFYYSLADAFTICDQNFCSSLTGTTPNRLHLWTGKVREDALSQARIRNEETDYGAEAQWKTFPERLQDAGISWKVYQNEISVGVGLDSDQDAWLANFTDNPLEWFSQYRVRFHPEYRARLPKKIALLKEQIAEIQTRLVSSTASQETDKVRNLLDRMTRELKAAEEELEKYTPENWDKLSSYEKELHQRAFATNAADKDYHELATVAYNDGSTTREMKVPKGDVLHQFRKDVNEGTLPTVSWLVAPENFSDHPGAPWYGAWYLSETMDILTRNPEVWKKTIFILCYDENDGYFDHVPPFVPPKPGRPETGAVSPTIDVSEEHVSLEMDLKRKPASQARESSIGLGYRVPLLIASPWTRGGAVNSQVFDHTSILMFLEKFLSEKTGKEIVEPNISSWRRAVCGDLTSIFRPYNGEKYSLPEFVKKKEFYESIHKAQFKQLPSTPAPLSASEIENIVRGGKSSQMPRQEPGGRPSSALPYELHAALSTVSGGVRIRFESRKDQFKEKSAGAAFNVYSNDGEWSCRTFAVAPGTSVEGEWKKEGNYHLHVDGPNGFMRVFKGHLKNTTSIDIGYEAGKNKRATGNLVVHIHTKEEAPSIEIVDNAYGKAMITLQSAKNSMVSKVLDLATSKRWYDFTVRVVNSSQEVRFAGRVETGNDGVTDPAIG